MLPRVCTEISTAASASSTSAVSYVHFGNGHLYFGMFGELLEPYNAVFWRLLKLRRRFKRTVTAFFSLLRSGRAPKCCMGLFAGYRSLVINRNESISDV